MSGRRWLKGQALNLAANAWRSPVRDGRPHLNRTTHRCLRPAGCYGDRGIEVLGLDNQETAHRTLDVKAGPLGGDGRAVLRANIVAFSGRPSEGGSR